MTQMVLGNIEKIKSMDINGRDYLFGDTALIKASAAGKILGLFQYCLNCFCSYLIQHVFYTFF